MKLLEPIQKSIIELEGNRGRISKVCRIFLKLKNQFPSTLMELHWLPTNSKIQVEGFLESRKQFSVKDIHSAANLLDPHFIGKHLSADEDQISSQFILEFAAAKDISIPDVIIELAEFKTRSGIFW